MGTTTRVLSASGVSARRGGRVVISGVDLEIERGEVVALLGPNGAGKSTLVAALAGLLPPVEGTIEQSGRVAAALQTPALARRSALANVEAALAWWGVPRSVRRTRAMEALAALGAADYAQADAAQLSGGEQRRVHLARALAVDPDVLLLDEPFAGLDPAARADLLYDASSALRAANRGTLVVVHDRSEAWALADRVLVLIDGRIHASGATRAVFEAPPDPETAAFVGFAGRLDDDGHLRMFRPSQVALAADGPIACTVTRRVPLEDGIRLELACDRGMLVTLAEFPGPAVGDGVRVRVEGGVSFATGGITSTNSSA